METTPHEADGDQRPPARPVRRVRIEGVVPLENYNELFRCFVGPAARMNLKQLKLGIRFVLESQADAPLNADDQSLKAMQEAARQLGLKFSAE
jgi:hypothetical protein